MAGLVLVAPAIVALRLSRNDSAELAAALEGVTDEVDRDRVAAKFADFRANTAGNMMCVHLEALYSSVLDTQGKAELAQPGLRQQPHVRCVATAKVVLLTGRHLSQAHVINGPVQTLQKGRPSVVHQPLYDPSLGFASSRSSPC